MRCAMICVKCDSKRTATIEYNNGEKSVYCYTCFHEERIIEKPVVKSLVVVEEEIKQ